MPESDLIAWKHNTQLKYFPEFFYLTNKVKS
ncbi:hypothetical protein EATA6166_45160 (plasmid) [Enterobacter asburiae]|nr:hypothetical protein EATA6166_45160 [Enterobacter asburiae]